MMSEGGEPDGDETVVQAEKKMPGDDSMSIPLPEGFKPPEGTKDGDTFEVIAKAKVMDGRLVFESFDGQKTEPDGDEETADESDAAAESALSQAIKSGGLRG